MLLTIYPRCHANQRLEALEELRQSASNIMDGWHEKNEKKQETNNNPDRYKDLTETRYAQANDV